MNTIRLNSRGEDVKTLQRALGITPVDGIFGVKTDAAVREYQRKNGLVEDGIVGNATWAKLLARPAQPENNSKLRKSRRIITEIIVHCSATREGQNVTVPQIRAAHLQRGFSDIGYHYVVYLDGSIHEGRNVDAIGAHCTGHNANSIGVCYVGGVLTDGKTPKDTRTPMQKEALVKLLTDLKKLYPRATIHGHREYANKACPCFDVRSEYKNI